MGNCVSGYTAEETEVAVLAGGVGVVSCLLGLSDYIYGRMYAIYEEDQQENYFTRHIIWQPKNISFL